MKRMRKFLGLTRADKLLLLQTLCVLGIMTVALRVVPFQTLLRCLRAMAARRYCTAGYKPSAERIAWATRVASRYIPKAVCLPQALTTEFLCKRSGFSVTLRIGVTRDADGTFHAHAWVEDHGRVIIGGLADLSRFVPMPALENKGV